MCIMMENALCPNCGKRLLVDKCLGEKDAVMKCKHCEKTFNVSFDEKTFPAKFNSFNWGAFLMGWLWCFFNGEVETGILLILLGIFSNVRVIGFIFLILYLTILIDLGRKGNKIVWNHKEWKSVEAFKNAQDSWLSAGIIYCIIGLDFLLINLAADRL